MAQHTEFNHKLDEGQAGNIHGKQPNANPEAKMPTELSEQVPQEPAASLNQKTKVARAIGIFLFLLVCGALTAYFISRYRNRTPAGDTAEQIQQAFAPPTGSSSTPALIPEAKTPPSTAAQTPTLNPARNQTPIHARAAAPQSSQVYRNAALGFEVTLPAGWGVDASHSGSNRIVFASNAAGSFGYVEMYGAGNGTTLDQLTAMYRNTPGITSVDTVNVQGVPAIRFTASQPGSSGIGIIYNGRIYYLRGAMMQNSLLSTFKFM